jgi:hypothetical protein
MGSSTIAKFIGQVLKDFKQAPYQFTDKTTPTPDGVGAL